MPEGAMPGLPLAVPAGMVRCEAMRGRYLMNIVDPILFQSRHHQSITAMCAPGAGLPLISYGRLARFIHNIARNAHAEGLGRGQTVALMIEEPILHAAFILGLMRLGIATVSVRGSGLPGAFAVDALITDQPPPSGHAGRVIIAGMEWTEGDGTPFTAAEPVAPGDICRISLTSGSTGEPKACAFSHDLIARRIARYHWAYGPSFTACTRIFVDPGLATSVGELFWLHALSRGGTVIFRGPDAVETLQAFSLYNVQCMVAAPAALAEFLDLFEQLPSFPSPFEVVVSVGSFMSEMLSERIRARLSTELICSYGSTETHIAATAPARITAAVPGAVGQVVPDTVVEIVDGDGHPVPVGEPGRVRIKSDVGVLEYLGDAPATAEAFRDGWFYSGDIGRLTSGGLLAISGRERTVLNLGGDKISPERIEQVLLSFPGIRHAAAFGKPNTLGIEELNVVVVGDSVDEKTLRTHCERRLAAAFVPRRFIRLDDIPVTEAGKIDRLRLAEIVTKD